MSRLRIFLSLLLALTCAAPAFAERIKDVSQVYGVRNNQLIGYGLVVGLDGSGDQTTQAPFTAQSLSAMLTTLGINLPAVGGLQLKNVAAVMVTAVLPPFSKPGQAIDVTVSSLANAKSLRGGTLIMTPLKGADGHVYAIAQGNILLAGVGAAAGGSSVQVNHLSAGRIPAGATVERAVQSAAVGDGDYITLELHQTDFTTVSRVVQAINRYFGDNTANALDGRMVKVRAPQDQNRRIAFLSQMENITFAPGELAAKVVLNPRTGSVVMNQSVQVDTCAVAHGNLSVTISSTPQVSQPGALSPGQTVVTQQTQIQIQSDKSGLVTLPASTSLSDVVKALNAVGATPLDLLAILQAMKASGALRAELEII
ncbi:MAG: flagellar basal body P-ring protein FlgI [Hydrogenophilales bacterium]|nr:flagellar basal body P-ring protein FlgI [Hydrogenophilales bacterium]